jgi:inner membrane protein
METPSSLSLNLIERFNKWIQESIMVKLVSIGFLILVLLIPASWIESIIFERQQRAGEVINEVASKWSGSQTISGPVLIIPYKKMEVIDYGKDGKEIRESTQNGYFLPDNLDITGNITPEELHRGIFDAVVYESALKVNATFSKPDFSKFSVADEMIQWKDAYLVFGITDLRGISENPKFTMGTSELSAEPSNNIGVSIKKSVQSGSANYIYESSSDYEPSTNGIVTKLGWTTADSFSGDFNMTLDLKGSRRLDFIPAGKTTEVKLAGKWNNPSFDGEFLPAKRDFTNDSFTASWKILHFNRPFSQQWNENNKVLSGADFGVRLLVPVDQYQKSIRTAKYGVLIILLTFMSLFLVEITQKIRIHPFQYILIGAALTIYYSLLLSFSEHLGYDLAYLVASLATVILISLYSTTFFTHKKLAILFSLLLTTFYGFIYVIILQQDFSLLLGSVALFAIIGTLMYFSRKVKWYKDAQTA